MMVKRETVSRVPFFSSIPLFGRLFQHKASVKTRKELLIMITPEIVSYV